SRTDIFSLGVVLYEMIAGRLPFEGSNRNEIMASVLSDKEPQPLTRYSSEAPAELGGIVLKALRKIRDERYQTIQDMLLDLKSLKQELEFAQKLEASVPPKSEADASSSAQFRVPPSGGRTAESKTLPPEGGTLNTRPSSSVEYVVSGIKQHKLGAALALAVLLLTIGVGYWFFGHRSSNVTTITSIAVMPFENATHDQKIEYLSDGVTESLINSLSQLPHITVIARNSVFSYKNQTPNLQQLMPELKVQGVLTGRVLMQGDTLDVRAEL